jgi:hypothetical protein
MIMYQVWDGNVFLYSVDTEAEVMEAELNGFEVKHEELVA